MGMSIGRELVLFMVFSLLWAVLVGVVFANEAIFDDLTNEFMLFERGHMAPAVHS